MLALILSLATATAADLDGTWQLVTLQAPGQTRTAAELMPEGCTSRELWRFEEGRVSRGHERSCTVDDTPQTCEVWVSVAATAGDSLLVPYTTEALGQLNTTSFQETTKKGATTTRKVASEQTCTVRLDKATWTIARDGDVLTLTTAGGKVVWALEPAT